MEVYKMITLFIGLNLVLGLMPSLIGTDTIAQIVGKSDSASGLDTAAMAEHETLSGDIYTPQDENVQEVGTGGVSSVKSTTGPIDMLVLIGKGLYTTYGALWKMATAGGIAGAVSWTFWVLYSIFTLFLGVKIFNMIKNKDTT